MAGDLTAVVWDFDGTLVDTRQKNLNVTSTLVELVKGVGADSFKALRSLRHYEAALQRHHDWKAFYRQELDMSEPEMLDAGSRWAELQLADRTQARVYDGIPEVLAELSYLPQGIVSLNSRPNILRFLERLKLSGLFGQVIGYEAFDPSRHKPHPDALVSCIRSLTDLRPGKVLYVGDHETDIECAHNTTAHFAHTGVAIEVLSVGAVYAPLADDSRWSARPHYRAEDPRQILAFAQEVSTLSRGAGLPSSNPA